MSRVLKEIVRPDGKSQESARIAAEFLGRETGAQYEVRDVRVVGKSLDVKPLDLPPEAVRLLHRVLVELAKGNAVTVVPVNAELTTQEGAEFLNVSRPHLVSLLEAGRLPFRKVGTKRRVRLVDLVQFKEIQDAKQKKAHDDLTAEAQKLGLGY